MMDEKNETLKKIHTSLQSRGFFSYLGAALFLAAAISILFVINQTRAAADVTVTTLGSSATVAVPQNVRTFHQTTDGKLIFIYFTGGTANLLYRTSTDNGQTWSGATTLVGSGMSMANSYMDSSNNIYLIYRLSTGGNLYSLKMTYDGTGWTTSTLTLVESGGTTRTNPNIIKDPQGVLWAAYQYYDGTSTYIRVTSSSDDGVSWDTPVAVTSTSGSVSAYASFAIYNNQYPVMAYGMGSLVIGARVWNGNAWSSENPFTGAAIASVASFGLITVGNNVHLYVSREGVTGIRHAIYSGSWSSLTTVTSATVDTYSPKLVTNGTDVWLLYARLNAASSYDIYYRKWTAAAQFWDTTATALTSNAFNNRYVTVPVSVTSTTDIPYIYVLGSTSTLYNSFSTILAAPVISSVAVATTSQVAATITWSTDVPSNSKVEYGLTSSYTDSTTLDNTYVTSSHSVTITGLSPGTTYHYRVLSSNGTTASSTDQTFTTSPYEPDVTPPSVTVTVPVAGGYASGTAFTFTATSTDNLAVTGIQFKVDGSNVGSVGSTSPYSVTWDSTAVAEGVHSVVAVANDAAGNYTTSTAVSFTVDNSVPVISSIATTTLTANSFTVTWTSDEPSYSQVEYGTTGSYGSATTLTNSTTTSHSVTVSGLATSTEYHFRVKSVNLAGLTASSSDLTITTTDGSMNAIPVTVGSVIAQGYQIGKTMFRSSGGTLAFVYQSGGSLYITTSSDSGVTWRPSNVIKTITNAYYNYSGYMDSSDNIYLVYSSNQSPRQVYFVKLTSTGGGWTAGTEQTVSSAGTTQQYADIIKDPSGNLWSAFNYYDGSSYSIYIKKSTDDGATWGTTTTLATSGSFITSFNSLAIYNNQYPVAVYALGSGVKARAFDGSNWTAEVTVDSGNNGSDGSFNAITVGNQVHYVGGRHTFGLVRHSIFDGSSWSSTVTVNSATSESFDAQAVTDGTNLWVTYAKQLTTNSYNIYYKKFTSSTQSWDSIGTPLTFDGANNRYAKIPRSVPSGAVIPVMYITGTASPYTLTFASFPSAPTAPSFSSVTSTPSYNSATISWNTNVLADGVVFFGTSTAYGSTSTSSSVNVSHSVTLTNLIPSTTYHFSLQGVSFGSYTATSSDYTFTTAEAPADSGAPSVTITSPSSGGYATGTAFTVSATSTDDITVMGVQFKINGSNIGSEDTLYPFEAAFDTTQYAEGSYTLVAVARDYVGNLTTSSAVTINIDNTGPTVTSVTVPVTRSTSADITWTTGEASTSQVEYGTTNSLGSFTTLDSRTTTNHIVLLNGLSTSTLYYYRVWSRDASGNATTSSISTFTTTNGTADIPFTPTYVSSTVVSDTEIALTWERGDNSATSFTIYRSTNGADYSIVTSTVGGTNMWVDTSLYPSTLYYYTISAANQFGSSPSSTAVSTSTQVSGATLNAATSFSFTSVTAHEITMMWTENINVSKSWLLERSTNGMYYEIIYHEYGARSSTYIYTDTEVSPGQTYYYRARAVNGNNLYSNYSEPASTTTLARTAGAPLEPTHFEFEVESATTTVFTWVDTNSGAASYVVETSPYIPHPDYNVDLGWDPILSWTQIAETDPGDTTFTLETESETFYYVRIRAKNNVGYSGYTRRAAVRSASEGTGSAKIYEVGPGKEYTSLGALDWSSLGPGDVVKVYPNRDENNNIVPYYEKPMISTRGTADRPITIMGVPDPATGQKPIIDGTNAITDSQWTATLARTDSSLIYIGIRYDQPEYAWSPGYLTFENFEVRNAYQGDPGNPVNTYTAHNGTVREYQRSATCIYLQKGDNITIRNNTIHGCNQGIFAAGQDDSYNVEDILVESNYIYNYGTIGISNQHATYIEGINVTYQFNRYGAIRTGTIGGALKDRGAGTIIRYNLIEGGIHRIALVEATNYMHVLFTLPSYRKTHIYGNIIKNIDTPASAPIRSGADQTVDGFSRKGVLYFYNNTVILQSDYLTPSAVVLYKVDTKANYIDARNNIVYRAPNTSGSQPSDLGLLYPSVGLGYFGNNWISSGWTPSSNGTHQVFAGESNIITNGSNNPGFTSTSTYDYTITGAADVIDRGSALWGDALPVSHEYNNMSTSSYRVQQGSAIDIGAYEYSVDDTTAPAISSVNSSVSFATATITWTTDEAATSLVQYGLTSSYGLLTVASSSLKQLHSIPLTGLSPVTTYHYSVISSDGFGNTSTSTDYTFTTSALTDVVAPLRFLGSPQGSLPAGTETVTLSLVTDEVATCKYSANSGTAYGSMTAFDSTGATVHSATISGLVNETSYNYYVKCQDAAGNKNATNYRISFAVSNQSNGGSFSSGGGGGGGSNSPTTTLPSGSGMPTDVATTTPPTSTPAVACTTTLAFNRDLRLGMTGTDIRSLQKFLNANGFTIATKGPGSPGNETDYFGNATRAALTRFQATNTQTVPDLKKESGSFGAATRNLVNTMIAKAEGHTLCAKPAPTPSTVKFTRNLKVGMRGEDVRQLQKVLNALNFTVSATGAGSSGSETTFFGAATRAALIRFQKAKGILPSVGYFGPITRSIIAGLLQ